MSLPGRGERGRGDSPFGPLSRGRKGEVTLDRLLDLAAPDATGAHSDASGLPFDDGPDRLQIGLEKPFGYAMRVADLVADHLRFATYETRCCHCRPH